jgi:hypothetical protein
MQFPTLFCASRQRGRLAGPRRTVGMVMLAGLLFTSCVAPTLQAPLEMASSPSDVTGPPSTSAVNQNNRFGSDHNVSLLPPEDPPRAIINSPWATDFSRRTVEWSEIRSGGPPKDGIPAIDNPEFEDIEAASEWLSSRDPVILFAIDDDVRAYPLAILMWHEIVNDWVGGRAVAVTFCPLCNASIVFDRAFDHQVLDFGTTGLLRNSDLVMYDRQTETWWQQFTGQGLVGQYAGEQLDFLAAQVISFDDFVTQFPDGDVLARPAATRSYGANPYTQYDTTTGRPFLFDGEIDRRLNPMERVVGLMGDERAIAYPFSAVAAAQAINDEFDGVPIVVMHRPGTASALDTSIISEGRDIGSMGVFARRVNGEVLTFEPAGAFFIDTETGSQWNHLGLALEGELEGTQLERILAFDHFWFAWAAFFPNTELYQE